MVCEYCKTYHDSSVRPDVNKRFCHRLQRIVSEHGATCDDFEESGIFWCKKNGEWIDFNICANRTKKDSVFCRSCHQRKDVLAVRIHIGRKNRALPISHAIIRRNVHVEQEGQRP